jgi:hypothetical protein
MPTSWFNPLKQPKGPFVGQAFLSPVKNVCDRPKNCLNPELDQNGFSKKPKE